MKIGDKVKIKGSGEVVKITGYNGHYYRVFVNSGGNMYHDWYPKDSLEKV